jgi:LmbE family N-acetylglucosaminyl deacetylase
MYIVYAIFLVILLVIVLLCCVYYIFALHLPAINKSTNMLNGNKALFIFPHPDDETMASAGLILHLKNSKNMQVKVISVTKGEHGDEILKLSPLELAEIRAREFAQAMSILGIYDYEIWDYIDGGLHNQSQKLQIDVYNSIKKFNPDVVITYEKHGIYGHKDHIELSKIVNNISKIQRFKTIYATLPKQLFSLMRLPIHMSENGKFLGQCARFRLSVFANIKIKCKAIQAYKSQNLKRGLPHIFFVCLVGIFEYYTDQY